MKRLRDLTVVLSLLVGMMGISGVALAEHEEDHPEDTWFSFGYDPLDHFLAINIGPNDVDDCVFEDGALTGTYGDPDEDGVYEVAFEGFEMCAVAGTVVAGPNGQVNHGQFMKAAKSLLDIKGHGCVVRFLAQSDIGKTDETKVRTGDAEEIEIGEDGTFSFSTFEADCSKGKKDKEKGRPESPGKSSRAPGHNK